ncbi:MAG: hypothetical protein Tsb002_30640 [Wenzhouxiangellaceae bacterium]
MSNALIIGLLLIFAIHCVLFGRLYVKRREGYYLAATITFLLLVLTYSARLLLPGFEIYGYTLFWLLRIAAWGSALVSISWMIKRRLGARRN